MTQHNPMESLPELPSEVGPAAAGAWCGAVLLGAATERQWPVEQLRLVVFLVASRLAGAASDETLHAELQQAIDASRALLAGKQ